VNLLELLDSYPTSDACREHLERVRWPDGVRCPRCNSDKIARLRKRKQFSCKSKDCGYRFSVTTDTIMHASKISLRKWFAAIYLMSDAKKSVSSLQLARELRISNECAWHMCMRIREAMREAHTDLFRGVVQCDEYYHGGDSRNRKYDRHPYRQERGRGTSKQPILGAVETSTGRIRTAPISSASSGVLLRTLKQWLKFSGVELHTDQWRPYGRVGRLCKTHKTVNHSIEYVTAGGVHNNHVESAWSLFNRSVIGSFHKISVKHLPRYLGEFDSRFNARQENGTYFPRILRQCVGRRLPMNELVNGEGLGAESR